MKPGKKDIKINIRIQGEQLIALQKISFLFTECFGLDSRIDKYKGTKSIGLYQWDFECLIGGIEYAISDQKTKNSMRSSEINALTNLSNTINEIYKKTYG
jgi:hypothetical protein